MNFNLRVKGFSLQQTLLSGQSFRFDEIAPNHYLVFAWNNVVEVEQNGDELFFKNSTCHPEFWHNYFDLNYNYSNLLCGFSGDSILEIVRGFCGGIRILKQNPFEVLICFLLSSCIFSLHLYFESFALIGFFVLLLMRGIMGTTRIKLSAA